MLLAGQFCRLTCGRSLVTPYELGKQAMSDLALSEDSASVVVDEVDGPAFARGFVDRLCELQDEQVPLFRKVLERTREQAADFQLAPMDSLLEVIQNADDSGATKLRFALDDGPSLAVWHDGRPLNGMDIVGIALPTITTKAGDADAIGRFGIGLKTVFSLAETISVRDSRYALMTSLDGVRPWVPRDGSGTEVLLALHRPIAPGDLEDWFDALGGDGLIFTKNLRIVEWTASNGSMGNTRLKRSAVRPLDLPGVDYPVTVERVGFWTVYRGQVPLPDGFKRDRKAVGSSLRLSVGIGPPQAKGRLSLGLPSEHRWAAPISYDAPFDPDATRRSIKENDGNAWMLSHLGELNAAVVRHRWQEDPSSMWVAVPLPDSLAAPREWLQDGLAAICARVAGTLRSLRVPGSEWPIDDAAWPDVEIEGVVDDRGLVLLSDEGILPSEARDGGGYWRRVVHAHNIGTGLGVADLVRLTDFEDSELSQSAGWFIAVAKVLLDNGESLIKAARILVDERGHRWTPREAEAGVVLVTGSPEHRFPVLRRIHDAYQGPTEVCSSVRSHLLEAGWLLREADDARVLAALAGRDVERPIEVDDPDLLWLRRALQEAHDTEREALSRRIGDRILLDGFLYDADEVRVSMKVRPGSAYLPSGLDRTAGSFGRAAGRTSRLEWVDRRYDDVLKLSAPRHGRRFPAAVAFLQSLGAATLPRLHAPAEHRYPTAPEMRGQLQSNALRKAARAAAKARNAVSVKNVRLVGDLDSPDLIAVAKNVARTQDGEEARHRGQALMSVLRRAWTTRDDPWEHHTDLTGTFTYYGMRHEFPGTFPATWCSRVAEIAWLPAAGGALRKPCASGLRTDQLLLVEGRADDHFVFEDHDEATISLSRGLGMRVTPEVSQVVDRLKGLRTHEVDPRIRRAANACYRLIAAEIPTDVAPESRVGDLQLQQLQGYFGVNPDRPGLVLCEDRWLTPYQVVIGSHGFGHLRGAVPDLPVTRPLWDAMGVHEEDPRSAHRVLEEIADRRLTGIQERAAMVQAFRFLAAAAPRERPRVAALPLLCGDEWIDARPVYACTHPRIATALAESVPVWTPGCDLSSLGGLPFDLGVTVVDAADPEQVSVVHSAVADAVLTSQFQRCVQHFRGLLEEHEPKLLDALRVSWRDLQDFRVGTSGTLRATVRGFKSDMEVELQIADAPDFGVVIRDGATGLLDDPEIIGELLSFFYAGSHGSDIAPLYRASLYWGQAWRRAAGGQDARPLFLDRVEPKAEATDDVPVLPERITGVRRDPEEDPATRSPVERPSLKTPDEIELVRVDNGGAATDGPAITMPPHPAPSRASTSLESAVPSVGRRPVRGSLEHREDTEESGWRIVEELLKRGKGDQALRDLRRTRGAGADGYDVRRDKAVELKAYRGQLPDVIQLQSSQIKEARERGGDFWLFVVGGLERGKTLVVRLFADPLRRLEVADQPSVRFRGATTVPATLEWRDPGHS